MKPARTLTRYRTQQRTVARTSLYSALVMVALILWLLLPWLERTVRFAFDPFWDGQSFADRIEVQRLRELLAIDTTHDQGREIDAARHLEGLLQASGVNTSVIELPEGRANLWAVVEGDLSEALVLHSHLDTTPVGDLESWLHPPFAGVIEGAWLYGRGAFDMKSTTIAQLQSVLAVKTRIDSGWRPRRSLILLATSGEETGSVVGTPWLLATQPWIGERAWAVLTEGGVYEGTANDTVKYWGVSYGQKQFVRYLACAAEREELEQLAKGLQELNRSAELRLAPEVALFFQAYASSRHYPLLQRPFLEPERILDDRQAFDTYPWYIQALFRDEVHGFSIEPGVSGGFQMEVVLHVLPGSDLDEVATRLLPGWLLGGVRLARSEGTVPAVASPLDHPAYEGLIAALEAIFPEAPLGPIFLSAYDNDGRFFRNAGIPTYGFNPFRAFSAESFSMDTGTEKIGVGAYVEGVGTYSEVVMALLD